MKTLNTLVNMKKSSHSIVTKKNEQKMSSVHSSRVLTVNLSYFVRISLSMKLLTKEKRREELLFL